MVIKIKNRITEYLGFDVDDFLNTGDFVTIFGGSVRDSIADLEIHDIDVLCLSLSMRKCESYLEQQGYIFDQSAYTKDFNKLYEGINMVIYEPHSWLKIIDNKIRRVQLIKPKINKPFSKEGQHKEIDLLKKTYFTLLKNVDLSCCGVSISKDGFKEECLNATAHCICQVYEEIPNALMRSDRLMSRKEKLNYRGWYDIHSMTPKNKLDKLEITIKQLSLNKKIKKINII